eukprot:gene25708-biopygen13547
MTRDHGNSPYMWREISPGPAGTPGTSKIKEFSQTWQFDGKVHPSRNAWRQQQVERCFGCPELRDPRRWPIKKRGGINDPQGWRWAARRRWRRGGGEESCAGVSREKRPRTRPGRVPDAPHTIEFEETDESSAVSPSPPKSAYPA